MTTISHHKIHNEETFETAIIDHLVHHGWEEGKASDYNAELALFPSEVISFLQTTQPKEWKQLAEFYKQDAEKQVIRRLVKEIDLRGMLDVVRHGITDSGIKFKLAYFEPDSKLNQETVELYKLNRLSVTRQVYYSTKNKNSIDLLLSLNGLPIATAELKNHFTGQTVANAKRQFRDDREPNEPLFQFKKRALVHFSVDPDEVYLTTKIDGKKTRFLPFNKGYNNGAGNPPTDGYRSAYLWEEVWMKDSWMNIISRFIHLQSDDITVNNKQYTKETMIFPRYHQLRAVRRLCTDCLLQGTGNNYLIQHSAGSGKSNTIAWLSHRLAGLHDHTDRRIFDSIIVITDRTVLDKQLQDTIYQFEHKTGVVECIENNSQELADALTKGSDIIITTLQKFPYVLDKVQDLVKNHTYAIVIDEAHSSQGGNASNKMSKVLAAKSLEEAESEEQDDDKTSDDYLREELSARGMHPNTSIFAFTATPKPKTLEVFGEKDSEGKPIPFDLYSMRQAIEEGFILDVLANYTTYNVFYKLNKKIEDDPELNKKKAAKAIGRFLSLHPYNLAQKTEVIIEHFKSVTMKKIGGHAKAMVVTGSRLHALRYYHEFRKYIKAHNYQDIRALVAFSGKVVDDGYPEGVSEAQLNGFGEKELPERFNSDDYKILLVADKYQTGFDQPLLHTMYVDKKLAGVKAVQTLSRLNRTCQGKEDTFVLDFVNNRDEILASFQPFYELTRLEETTDPNHLYDLKNLLDASGVYQWSEINAFANLYFTKEKHNVKDQARLYGWIDPAVDRFKVLSDEKKDEFKQSMNAFVRLYSYLSQVLPFQDVELEKLYTYGRFLLLKLPKRDGSENVSLDNDVALEYYRLQKMEEGAIVLQKQGSADIRGVSEAGVPYGNKDEKAKLSDIISVLNDRLGTDFVIADRLMVDQIEETMFANDKLRRQAQNNDKENFKYGFEDALANAFIDRMGDNQQMFEKFMTNTEFKSILHDWLLDKLYDRFNSL